MPQASQTRRRARSRPQPRTRGVPKHTGSNAARLPFVRGYMNETGRPSQRLLTGVCLRPSPDAPTTIRLETWRGRAPNRDALAPGERP
jgi:hypothetical protein